MLSTDTSPASTPPAQLARRRFVLTALGLLALWLVVYEGYIGPDGRVDAWLTLQVTSASTWLLHALGFAATMQAGVPLLYMDGLPAVKVGAPCDGLALYALFTGFVLAYPGPWRVRLWFIPLGVAGLFGLNIVRVAALALNHHYAHQSVEFNHHYTFSFVVYACICGLWAWWVRVHRLTPTAA